MKMFPGLCRDRLPEARQPRLHRLFGQRLQHERARSEGHSGIHAAELQDALRLLRVRRCGHGQANHHAHQGAIRRAGNEA